MELTGGARIIERSQEYKSTVKYRTFCTPPGSDSARGREI